MLQLSYLLELLGLDHSTVQIHDRDAKIPFRQVKRIPDRTPCAIHHDLTAAPQDPERNLPFFGEGNLGHEGQRQ